jgi:hypothetical protein
MRHRTDWLQCWLNVGADLERSRAVYSGCGLVYQSGEWLSRAMGITHRNLVAVISTAVQVAGAAPFDGVAAPPRCRPREARR